jgi:hypothetical protein|tara:strand:- start:19 stop:573 length:555 start_codon:yes stop_codon:yes gene_type:complete
LSSYGDIVELDWEFDTETIIKQLSELDNWEQGPNGKKGINLTGPVSGLGLNDKNKHSEDQEANENLLKCEDLHNFFKKWQNLARCRAVHMNAGSFFRLHRDAYRDNPQMRIFIPLNKTDLHEWAFMYNDKLANFKAGKAYILNTRKPHGSFAMVDDIYHILMSVHITEENFKTVTKMLPNCKEH